MFVIDMGVMVLCKYGIGGVGVRHRDKYGSGFWHTVAYCVPVPQYCGYVWLNYSRVGHIFSVFKPFFSLFFFWLNSLCHDVTQPNIAMAAACTSLFTLCSHSLTSHMKKKGKSNYIYIKN